MPSLHDLQAAADALSEVGLDPGVVTIVLGVMNVLQTILVAWLTLRYESNARHHPRRRSVDG